MLVGQYVNNLWSYPTQYFARYNLFKQIWGNSDTQYISDNNRNNYRQNHDLTNNIINETSYLVAQFDVSQQNISFLRSFHKNKY